MLVSIAALVLMIQPLPPPFPRDGATKVFENKQVIIWDVSWQKGRAVPLHEHRYASVSVTIQTGRVNSVLSDGTAHVGIEQELGSVTYFERGLVHRQEGVSDTPRRSFVIELKENTLPPDPVPDDVVPAWPRDGAKKVLENELVLVWDYTFAADLEIPFHYHDKDHVHVSLAPGRFRRIPRDGGEPILSDRKAGNAAFVPRGALHREEYVDGGLRVVVIQLLGR